MIRRYTVALMQMDTQNDKGKNLETACAWIDEAAAKRGEAYLVSRR